MLSVNTFFIVATPTFFYFSHYSPNNSLPLPQAAGAGCYWALSYG